jgi:glycosyltransferase involved in cell wall biosynthesis
MPSLVETVGLPMLEAASVGTAIVAADRLYAHDVCGDAALYFDPLDARDLAAKLGELLSNSQLRADLTVRGTNLVARRAGAKPYEKMIHLLADLAERAS